MLDEDNLRITKDITKVTPSKLLIQEILTIFSMPALPSSSICTNDQILTRNILSTKPEEEALTSAAILLNFQASLFIDTDNTNLNEILRKMIAFGFFAPQIYHTDNFSSEVQKLIQYVSNHLKNSTLNISQCSAATAFLLSSISPYASLVFKNVLDLQNVMDIYLTKKVINDLVIPLFFDFFLSVFLSLTLDKEIDQKEFEIFSNLMKIMASTIMTNISFNFDYVSLTEKLLEYISNHFLLLPTRIELFNLLISLSTKFEATSTILVDPSRAEKVSIFIADYIKSVDFQYDLKPGLEPIDLNKSTYKIEKFLEPLDKDFEYIHRPSAAICSGISEPSEIEPLKKLQPISILNQMISNLCRSIKVQKLSQNHIRFLTAFLRNDGIKVPIGAFFIDSWVSNFFKCDSVSISEYLHTCKYYQAALEFAFLTYDDEYLRQYIKSLYLWISANYSKESSFIIDLINVLQNTFMLSCANQDLCDLLLKIAVMNISSFLNACKISNFHLYMVGDLDFYTNTLHFQENSLSEEQKKRIIENYYIILQFLSDLGNDRDLFNYLFSNSEYADAVLNQFFCSSTANFAYTQISRVIEYSNVTSDRVSPAVRMIFKFFATKLFKTPGMPANVLNYVIKFCILAFDKIPNQAGLMFKESRFMAILVNFTIDNNLFDSVEVILDLFVKISMKKCNYSPNIELFLKLSPLIKSHEDMSLVDYLLKIIFNDELKMTQPRKIVNPGPLSLLFQIFKSDKEKFVDYLTFVQKCFDFSMFEAVQTDFPSQLILFLSEYRYKTEKDELFDLVLNFLKDMMTLSVTSKDLLHFFQLFTSTKDNVRPFFTGDLIKTLITVLQSHQETARSFFSLDGKGSIVLPIISAESLANVFSVVLRIEILDRCGSIISFTNMNTNEFIQLEFTEDKFLRLNGIPFEETFKTGKWVTIELICTGTEYIVKEDKEEKIRLEKNKNSLKTDLIQNMIAKNLKANIEYIQMTSNKNKVFEFHAESFCNSYAVDDDQVAKVNGTIFHLPSPLRTVFTSIGGISVCLPLLAQIEQPTNATNPNPNENLLELVLQLFFELFKNSRQQQSDFCAADGFKLFSELLTLISIDKFTPNVFKLIINIFTIILDKDLLVQMTESIIFDFGTWVYVSDVDKYFYEQIFPLMIKYIQNYPSLKSVTNIKNVLFLFRCHLYTSNNNDPSICLSQSQKTTLDGRVIAERPKLIKNLRDKVMNFIVELSKESFTDEDFNTLLFLCFDQSDFIIQKKSQTILNKIVSHNDNKHIVKYVSKLPYKDIIEGLSKEKKFPLELVGLINAIISSNYKIYSAKQIIAKVLKEFDPSYSEQKHLTFYLKLTNDLAIPLYLYSLTHTQDTSNFVQSYKHLLAKITDKDFIENEELFIIFLLHCFLDKQRYGSFYDDLIRATIDMWTKVPKDPLVFLQNLIDTIGFRTNRDFADFLRQIFMYAVFTDFPSSTTGSIAHTLFKFLFEIPTYDGYSSLFSFPQPNKPMSFLELFNIINTNDINGYNDPSATSNFVPVYHFGIRVNDNGQWVDLELANLFCEKFLTNNSIPNIEEAAYIVGYGLIEKVFIKHAEKIMKALKLKDSSETLSQSRKNALVIIFGCISRQLLQGSNIYNDLHDKVFLPNLSFLSHEIFLVVKKQQNDDNEQTPVNYFMTNFAAKLAKLEEEFEIKICSPTIPREFYKIFGDSTPIENHGALQLNLDQYRTSLSNYTIFQKKVKLQSMKRYKQLFSQLSSDNGPWMTPEAPPVLHYKHDNNMTRSRLVPNLKFNSHQDASLARDLGSYENAQAVIQEQIAKLKLKTFATDFNLIDFDNIEDEKDEKKVTSDKDLIICQSQLITPRKLHSGELNLTKKAIYFDSNSKFVKISLKKIKKILLRRYLMVDTAIEIFTTYSKVYFVNFFNDQERSKFLNKLSTLKISNIKFIQKRWDDIKPILKRIQKKWQDGLISNFEYIMKINILAGRSFNDLSQYPVYPWVIKEYNTDTIDLNNPEIYRDLSKPVGALGKERLELMRERMEAGIGEDTKYLYGALYSSPAVVIGYLIRMEPFTSLHVQLQSNRFDVADRLFVSIPSAYESVTTTQMDFRELIPEFFLIPDFLNNVDNFDLGTLATSKEKVDNVKLPKWAKDPRQFIEINKRALESDYVTEHLHLWLDLLFGPHSRAPLNVEVDNVFSPGFYETALEGADEAQTTYLKEYAACFGCACYKIFDDFPEPYNGLRRRSSLGNPKTNYQVTDFGKPLIWLTCDKNSIVAISSDLQFALNDVKSKFHCRIPQQLEKIPPIVSVSGRIVAISTKWASKVQIYEISRNGTYELLNKPSKLSQNTITALSVSQHYIATAFADNTLRVFKNNNMKQVAFLSKHSYPISFAKICEELGNVYTISNDGFISSISLNGGRYLKGTDAGFSEPTLFTVSRSGFVIIAFNGPDSCNVVVLDQNLESLQSVLLETAIEAWTPAEICGDELLLISSKNVGGIVAYRLPFLEHVRDYHTKVQVTAITFKRKPIPRIVIGTGDGTVAEVDI